MVHTGNERLGTIKKVTLRKLCDKHMTSNSPWSAEPSTQKRDLFARPRQTSVPRRTKFRMDASALSTPRDSIELALHRYFHRTARVAANLSAQEGSAAENSR